MKCSFRPGHVQPPSSLSTRCSWKMEKCPERHPSPTLGSATTLRFPLAVISTARSWKECLATGCHGNWSVGRLSYAVSLSWESFLFCSHTSSITHMPNNRLYSSTFSRCTWIFFNTSFSCKRYDVCNVICFVCVLFVRAHPPLLHPLTEVE